MHGGDLTVTSTLGEGSQFTLFLPNPVISKAVENEKHEEDQGDEGEEFTLSSSPDISKNKTILLIEEEEKLQQFCKTIFIQLAIKSSG